MDGQNAAVRSENDRTNVLPVEERFLDRASARMLVVHENVVVG